MKVKCSACGGDKFVVLSFANLKREYEVDVNINDEGKVELSKGRPLGEWYGDKEHSNALVYCKNCGTTSYRDRDLLDNVTTDNGNEVKINSNLHLD